MFFREAKITTSCLLLYNLYFIMNLYTKEQVSTIKDHTFAYLIVEEADNVLTLTLNRERTQ